MHLIATTLVALALALAPGPDAAELGAGVIAGGLETVAERSGYRATARYDDVVALGKRLAESSKLVHVGALGKTVEGRPIPLWVVADPPVAAPPGEGASDGSWSSCSSATSTPARCAARRRCRCWRAS